MGEWSKLDEINSLTRQDQKNLPNGYQEMIEYVQFVTRHLHIIRRVENIEPGYPEWSSALQCVLAWIIHGVVVKRLIWMQITNFSDFESVFNSDCSIMRIQYFITKDCLFEMWGVGSSSKKIDYVLV
jgi:hypothetical protein